MRQIKLFLRKLLRLVEWIPVIWRGGDYDYSHSIDVFQYQLKRTADYIEHSGHLENSKLVVSQIRTAVDLIDKVYKGGYQSQAEEEFRRQYGDCDIKFNKIDDDSFDLLMWWDSAEDSEHNDKINEFYRSHMMASYNKETRDQKVLWNYIDKNILTWWD